MTKTNNIWKNWKVSIFRKKCQQRSQLASCRVVFCAGLHVVSWTPHGICVETIWCPHLEPHGVHMEPWKWHGNIRETAKFIVFRLISIQNWDKTWKACRFHLEIMWKWCCFHLVLSHNGNNVVTICGNRVETTKVM